MENMKNILIEKFIKVIEKSLILILILILAILIPKMIRKSFKKIINSNNFDSTLIFFFQSLSIIGFRIFALILFFRTLEVDLNSFFTCIGAVGISLGFSLQQSISSLCSGFVIILSRTIKTGQKVEIGNIVGIVKHINLMNTIVKTDKGEVIVPNNYITSNFIKIIKEN